MTTKWDDLEPWEQAVREAMDRGPGPPERIILSPDMHRKYTRLLQGNPERKASKQAMAARRKRRTDD